MFARAAAVFVLALPFLATATVLPRNGRGGKPGKPSNPGNPGNPSQPSSPSPPTQPSTPAVSECNNGSVQCCNSAQEAHSGAVEQILGLFGIPITSVTTGQVGLSCSGVDSPTSCSQQSVCCNGDNFSGLIVIGCSPITINI